jgi:hypothetical protein
MNSGAAVNTKGLKGLLLGRKNRRGIWDERKKAYREIGCVRRNARVRVFENRVLRRMCWPRRVKVKGSGENFIMSSIFKMRFYESDNILILYITSSQK